MNLLQALRDSPIPKELRFDEDEYGRRLGSVRLAMAAKGLDALVVGNTANICWLTGYESVLPSGPSLLVVFPSDECVVICPDLELSCFLLFSTVESYRVESWQDGSGTPPLLADVLRSHCGPRARVGIELSKLDAYANAGIDAGSYLALAALLPDVTWVDEPLLIASERVTKSDAELGAMRVAAEFTKAGMLAAFDAISDGAAENEINAALYGATIAAGSDVMAIDPMIVSGEHGGYMPFLPHGTRRVRSGDTIYLESSGSFKRYNAPLMRTAALGSPSLSATRLSRIAEETVGALLGAIRSGRTGDDIAREVGRAMSSLPENAYFAGTFGYTCGIGIQPTWTEAPFYIAVGSEFVLRERTTLHLPICLWSPQDKVGVGISETVVVTEGGCELISTGPDRALTTI